MDYKRVAQDCIARMKTARPMCEKCETLPYFGHKSTRMLPPGFEHAPNHAGYVKRCDSCANGQLFSWADKLDVERVAYALEYVPACQEAFDLAILEETLHYPEGVLGYNKLGHYNLPVYKTLRSE